MSKVGQSTIVKFSLRDVELAHPHETGSSLEGEGLAFLRRLARSESSSVSADGGGQE